MSEQGLFRYLNPHVNYVEHMGSFGMICLTVNICTPQLNLYIVLPIRVDSPLCQKTNTDTKTRALFDIKRKLVNISELSSLSSCIVFSCYKFISARTKMSINIIEELLLYKESNL